MRTAVASITILCSFLTTAQFAPPGAQWVYGSDLGPFVLAVTGDTVINGQLCATIKGPNNGACYPTRAYVFQSGDQVFFHAPSVPNPDPVLLYDWSKAAGESWNIELVPGDSSVTLTYHVLSTGTTEINGVVRRTQQVFMSDNHDDMWVYTSGSLIEGIGDHHYLFPWLVPWCDPIVADPLLCYTDDVIGLFLGRGVDNCDLSTGISAVERTPDAAWFPSLVEAGTATRIRSSGLAASTLEVLDPSGRVVTTIRANSGQAELKLNVAGCYLLRWEEDGQMRDQRIVVHRP
jgi:hypothetical protein